MSVACIFPSILKKSKSCWKIGIKKQLRVTWVAWCEVRPGRRGGALSSAGHSQHVTSACALGVGKATGAGCIPVGWKTKWEIARCGPCRVSEQKSGSVQDTMRARETERNEAESKPSLEHGLHAEREDQRPVARGHVGKQHRREGKQASGPAGQRAGIGTGPSHGGPLLWQLSWASSGLYIILQKGSKLVLNFKPKKG